MEFKELFPVWSQLTQAQQETLEKAATLHHFEKGARDPQRQRRLRRPSADFQRASAGLYLHGGGAGNHALSPV